MRRVLLLLAGCAIVGAVIAGPGTSSPTSGRQLEGTVGPGFTITLTEDGEPVTSLRPGTYWLTVDDRAANHNFHLTGLGIDERITTVPFIGTATVKIHLEHGTYRFQCDPHQATMHGSFDVGGVGQVG
jgi:hypothetical protein